MGSIQEVAVTSCLKDPVVSAYVWDARTGTSLMTYRGDTPISASGLSLLSAQYVLAALQDKPFLRVWPVNSQQALSSLRLVCPGRVTHACVSPDNCYIAVTVAEKLHVYQVGSGRLVWSGVRHFQPITVLRWTTDGNLCVCGGEDGLVMVWSLATSQTAPEPLFVLSDHSLPVTGLAVSSAGSRSRLFSVSADRSCKIYDLSDGSLLVSLVCDRVLMSVAVATLETDVFLGTDTGAILQFSLLSPPRHLEYHLSAEESAPVFTGHTKAVTCLSTSLNGDLLLSGSSDGSVRVWHIGSHQCLRTLTHKGPVTNAFFTRRPKHMFEDELKPSVILNSFQTANTEVTDVVDVMMRESLSLSDEFVVDLFPTMENDGSEEQQKSLQTEIDLLRSINSNLYKFTVDKIIEGNSVLPPPPEVIISEPVKKIKKRNKRNPNKSSVTVKHNVVPGPVNGIPSNKKRKRKKNKNKINN